MAQIGQRIAELSTPCLVVDLDRMESNIRKWGEMARRSGVSLRPHVKTHKTPEIAHMQLESGAVGITVAKVSEAEVFAAGGIRDIFIAYPLIGADKVRRAAALARRHRIIVGADSVEGLRGLSEGAAAAGTTLLVRVEVNSGLNRAGVTAEQAGALARLAQDLPGIELEGIFTFRGISFAGQSSKDPAVLGREEGEFIVGIAEQLRAAGIPVGSVSAGSTPTSPHAAQVKGVTEVRPGTYVFQDRMQVKVGSCEPDERALTILATVVSRPSPDTATVDGGSKAFCGDIYPPSLGLVGYGEADGVGAIVVESMSEEHGVVRLGSGISVQIGQKLQFFPNHVCTSVNLSDELIGVRGGMVERVWTIQARGRRE
jgi:D-serine deaminase-like pyridoxal phosphate-dependent protein